MVWIPDNFAENAFDRINTYKETMLKPLEVSYPGLKYWTCQFLQIMQLLTALLIWNKVMSSTISVMRFVWIMWSQIHFHHLWWGKHDSPKEPNKIFIKSFFHLKISTVKVGKSLTIIYKAMTYSVRFWGDTIRSFSNSKWDDASFQNVLYKCNKMFKVSLLFSVDSKSKNSDCWLNKYV